MAKRFTDTEKWKKEWFRLLPVKMKAAWEYLRDNCDQAGIWDGDFGLMSFQIGEKVSKEECESHFGPDRFSAIGEGKYLLPGFIPFQYGNLSASNKAHSGILKRVESVRVRRLSIDPPERVSGESRESPPTPLRGPMEMETEEEVEKEMETEKEKKGVGGKQRTKVPCQTKAGSTRHQQRT